MGFGWRVWEYDDVSWGSEMIAMFMIGYIFD